MNAAVRRVQQKQNKPWTISDVTIALKALKSGKSRVQHDFPNELFKPDVAGDDLVKAIKNLPIE